GEARIGATPSSDLSWTRLPEPKVGGYDIEPDGREDVKVENRWFSLVIDGHHGDIRKLVDRRTGVDVFSGHAAAPIVVDDPTDTWSHGVFSFHEERGRFGAARVRVVEEGPVRIVVRARSSFGSSTLLQDFILYREIPRITVRAVVDWHEKLSLLKISFPVGVQKPAATYEIPYGHIQRPCNGEEEPGQNWVDVSGEASVGGRPTSYGLSVLNDCTYSFDVRGGDLRLTILRSPVYAHHTPTVLEENGDYVYMDQGRHAFSYELVPHTGSWQDGETVRSAQVLNAPLVALVEHAHAGDLPAAASHIQVDAPNVIATVLKQREDSRDLVLRCYESVGRATEATIDLPLLKRKIPVSLKPCEIKTFVIPREPSKPVAPTDFLED
ncbi:MAG TPA: glycoside hydrolase family 38 C-terminal domain-containing protein, partial [Spirochaetia bacterium]|nr:glycoside hydrolase family 38 C-terminal domain-containing protein [Spirochaetia bacterium]